MNKRREEKRGKKIESREREREREREELHRAGTKLNLCPRPVEAPARPSSLPAATALAALKASARVLIH